MNLRVAAAIALGLFLLAQVLATLDESGEFAFGWLALATAMNESCDLVTPRSPLGSAGSAQYRFVHLAETMAYGGVSANLALALAVACAFRGLHAGAISAAWIALLNAAVSLILLALQDGPLPSVREYWLWFAAIVWLAGISAYVWIRDVHRPAIADAPRSCGRRRSRRIGDRTHDVTHRRCVANPDPLSATH